MSAYRGLGVLLGLVVVASTAATGGCAVHSVKKDRKLPVALPDAYQGGGDGKVATGRWWTSFGDTRLDALVDTALQRNFDVRRAWARVDMIRAIGRMSGAARMPQVNASVDASYSERTMFIQDRILVISGGSVPLSVTASYELDLWGRVSANRSAALTDVAASREDLSTIAMSVSAAVVESWLGLQEARAQIELLERQVEVGRKLLGVVEGRFAQGLTTAVDVYQQRQVVAGVQGQLPRLQATVASLENQLRMLLGGMPGAALDVGADAALPALPGLPPTGVPANLLDNRPDVRAARLRVLAADHRVGVALADRYPNLRLSAQAGLAGVNQKGEFLTNPVWSLAAGLLAPIFDGGRRKAEVDRTRAVLQEAVLGWVQAVQKAAIEVANALRNERQQQLTIKALDGQLELAGKTLHEARRRYAGGVGDYLRVLTALQGLQNLERQRLSATRQLLSHRVSLHRALGGIWTAKLGRDPRDTRDPTGAKSGGSPNNDG